MPEHGGIESNPRRNNTPTVPNAVWSYYLSRRGGGRILVVRLRNGQRTEVSDAARVHFLDVCADELRLASQ
jgi:hypothetical protein